MSFFDKDAYDNNKDIHRIIDFRIRGNKDFFVNRKTVFFNFAEFLQEIRNKYNKKHQNNG